MHQRVRGPAAFAKNPDAAIRGTAGGSFVPRRSELPQEVVDDFIDDRFRSVLKARDRPSGFSSTRRRRESRACFRSCPNGGALCTSRGAGGAGGAGRRAW